MGLNIPSFSNIAQTVGKAVGEAAGKVASAVTQQPSQPTQTPAQPQKPVDSFESAPSKPAVSCGANDAAGAGCMPSWGKESGGGGGPAGVNPSNR